MKTKSLDVHFRSYEGENGFREYGCYVNKTDRTSEIVAVASRPFKGARWFVYHNGPHKREIFKTQRQAIGRLLELANLTAKVAR